MYMITVCKATLNVFDTLPDEPCFDVGRDPPVLLFNAEAKNVLAAVISTQGSTWQEHYSSIPAIDAEIRFAMVPASMARKPRRASSLLLLGASAPMPPI